MLAVRPWMQLRKSACIRAPSRDSAQPPFPARPGRVGFDGPPSPQQGCADFPDAWQVLADDVGGFYSAGHRRTDDFIKLQLQACESQETRRNTDVVLLKGRNDGELEVLWEAWSWNGK
ncbi:uncharacterized protein AAG666_023222 isoform 4-T20 [Megaptera novaeangliae]